MRYPILPVAVPILLLAGFAPPLQAQQPDPADRDRPAIAVPAPVTFDRSGVQEPAPAPSAWRPLRIAKWTVLAASAGAGIYGFVQNGRADERFRDLETMCQAERLRCSRRLPDGAYVDSEFERLFDDVRMLDRRSHAALLLSQVGVATGVVLFLLDLGNTESPSDIPFVPTGLVVGPAANGQVSLGWRLELERRD